MLDLDSSPPFEWQENALQKTGIQTKIATERWLPIAVHVKLRHPVSTHSFHVCPFLVIVLSWFRVAFYVKISRVVLLGTDFLAFLLWYWHVKLFGSLNTRYLKVIVNY